MLLLASLALLAWIYLAFLHGRFWRSGPVLPAYNEGSQDALPRVALVVPARDEAASIQQSIGSLLCQEYAGELAVILVDDNSTDGTAALAASLKGAERLTILRGAPLPAGWSGKLWAVHQGLQHALAQRADYVLLTDADIEHAPDHLARLVAKAQVDQLDLASEMVRLHCETAAEYALIPAFIFSFKCSIPSRGLRIERKKLRARPAEPSLFHALHCNAFRV